MFAVKTVTAMLTLEGYNWWVLCSFVCYYTSCEAVFTALARFLTNILGRFQGHMEYWCWGWYPEPTQVSPSLLKSHQVYSSLIKSHQVSPSQLKPHYVIKSRKSTQLRQILPLFQNLHVLWHVCPKQQSYSICMLWKLETIQISE